MMTEGGQNNEGGEGSALASINEVLEALDPENREIILKIFINIISSKFFSSY